MIQFKSDHGDITVSSAVFSNITGMAATNCFGVKGMAYRSMTDGLVHLYSIVIRNARCCQNTPAFTGQLFHGCNAS